MTDPINPTDIDQTNYMKLFMQELTYQDPLKPVDNREFMAQMAQLSSLQEARTSNEHLSTLLGMTSANQSLALLGKEVRVEGAEGVGTVTNVQFFAKSPTLLSVHMEQGGTSHVELTQITEVEQ